MAQEVQLTNSQRGTGRASADIVIWKTKEEKQQNKTAFLVVELKAENLSLRIEDCYQGYNYATWSRAKIFAISNGRELQVYKTDEETLPIDLKPVNDIPDATTILDENKLKTALAKTKEFKGDEFAKLLHKCHNIIRNNDKLSPEASFDEISKILFIKIMYERNPKQEAIFSKAQFERQKEAWDLVGNTGSYMQRLFTDVKEEFQKDGIFDSYEEIKIRETSFEAIVRELEIYNLTSTSSDVKGIAFERFLGRTFRGELGQFFTPRTIVDFIIDILEPKENELICDPCAGSGGFLIKTFETIAHNIREEYQKSKIAKKTELFGEFNKLSEKEEQELSKDDLKKYKEQEAEYYARFDDEDLTNQLDEFIKKQNKKEEDRIRILSHKTIFGTDANPRMARVSKMNMIMHGDGHNGIHHHDGLLNVNGIFRERFDVIITNPPFGTTLDKKTPTVENDDRYTNQEIINKYTQEYGEYYKQEQQQVTENIGKPIRELFEVGKTSGATEVLFIERCLDLLKPSGRMGIVLPEGVLNSSNLQKARDFFESKAKIRLIVSLPQDVFISSGATVKTSLVFFQKFSKEEAKQYEQVKEKATVITDEKYYNQISEIESKLKLRGNKAPNKEEKKELRKQLKNIDIKKQQEIKAIIKEEFDYQIPITEVKQAGITTTGQKGDNELPKVTTAFAEYRKQHNLW
jgi:type I restriction enzyme M protein